MHQPTRDNLTEELFAPVMVRAYTSPVEPKLIETLRAEEACVIAPMAPARQAEFATARACARAALADLGVDAAIPRRQGGSPVWPQGMAGSISHTRGFCLAVASSHGHVIGIDVEEVERMSSAVERRILVDAERMYLGDMSVAARQRRVATIFAAKEAFYKAHYELDARYLGFDVVEVRTSESAITFHDASGSVPAEILERTVGRARMHDGRVIVGVSISPVGLAPRVPSRP